MEDHCTHLEEILKAETEIIQRHVNEHKWYMSEEKGESVEYDDAIIDFVDKYAWIMREFYCGYVCEFRADCEPAQKYMPHDKTN